MRPTPAIVAILAAGLIAPAGPIEAQPVGLSVGGFFGPTGVHEGGSVCRELLPRRRLGRHRVEGALLRTERQLTLAEVRS